jgi:hypothetical protein
MSNAYNIEVNLVFNDNLMKIMNKLTCVTSVICFLLIDIYILLK